MTSFPFDVILVKDFRFSCLVARAFPEFPRAPARSLPGNLCRFGLPSEEERFDMTCYLFLAGPFLNDVCPRHFHGRVDLGVGDTNEIKSLGHAPLRSVMPTFRKSQKVGRP